MLLAEQLYARPELRGMAFNFSNELQVTVLELVERTLELLDPNAAFDMTKRRRERDLRSSVVSAEASTNGAGMAASYLSLDEGLRRTIDWYRTMLGKAHG